MLSGMKTRAYKRLELEGQLSLDYPMGPEGGVRRHAFRLRAVAQQRAELNQVH